MADPISSPSRRSIARRAATVLAGALACAGAPAEEGAPHDGLHDFDFLVGRWHVHLRKLLHPLTGSTEWADYEGSSVTSKLWDGRANTEEFEVASRNGKQRIDAQTLRLYDPGTRRWSLWLADAAHGKLSGPPTVGAFEDGRGEFLDAEDHGGRTILVRYVWTRPTPTTARMAQSFSADWGRTWEVNWICELTPP